MIKNRLIPFGWLPASWGLNGPLREEAEAHYLYDGYDLEIRLAEIKLTGVELERTILEIKNRYGVIDDFDYEIAMANTIADSVAREVEIIDINIRYGNMDPFDGDKKIATVKGEPWIRVVNDGVDPAEGPDGYFFEFDWNDVWITMLRDAGYTGSSDEEIVQAWFKELCRQEAFAAMEAPTINGGIIRG